MALVLAVIGYADLIRDFGLANAAIQSRELTSGQRNNLFWTNTAIGAILALGICAAAWPLSLAFGDARLLPLFWVTSLALILSGLSTQHRAHLMRDLRFASTVVVDVAALGAALLAALLAALAGWGVWALVIQQLVRAAVVLVGSMAAAPWRPGPVDRTASIRGLLRYGANLLGSQSLNYVSRNLDTVLIGAVSGARVLGFYDRAFQLLMAPLTQINGPATRVALPVLARLQSDPRAFARYVIVAQTVLLQGTVSLCAWVAAAAGPVVAILLGAQWAPTAPLLAVLAIGGVFQAAGYARYWVFLAVGATGSQLRFGLIVQPIFVVLLVFGCFFGSMGVAVGFTVGQAVIWGVGLLWLRRTTETDVRAMLNNALRAIAVYAAAAFVEGCIVWGLDGVPDLLRVLAATGGFAVVVVLAACIWPNYRRDLGLLVEVLRRLRNGGVSPRSAGNVDGSY